MPIFNLVVDKSIGQEHWTNRYRILAADIDAAKTQADGFVSTERAVHKTTVTFNYYRLSDPLFPNRNFRHILIELAGQNAVTSGSLPLPLWNCVRVIFTTNTYGRPETKLLRLPLYTDEIDNSENITTTKQTYLYGNYANTLVTSGHFCDKNGNVITGSAVQLPIFDRDLERRKKYPKKP